MKYSNRSPSFIQKFCLVLVPLLIFEVLARLGHTVLQDMRDWKTRPFEWYRYSAALHWERQPRFTGIVYGAFREFDSSGLFLEDSDDISRFDVHRVLLMGDSCTFGDGVAVSNTFGEVLEKMVPSTAVVNLAVPGYSSFQGRRLLEAAIERVKPDIVVISFSYNDRRYTCDPSDSDNTTYFRRSYVGNYVIPRIENISHLFRVLRNLVRSPREPPSVVDVNLLQARVGPQAYHDNILAMAKIARAHGVVPVFLAFCDNPVTSRDIRNAIALNSQGEQSAALAELRRCSSLKNEWTCLAQIYLCQAMKRGAGSTAMPDVTSTVTYIQSLHGGYVIEIDSVYNEIAKKAAGASRMIYVDAAEALKTHPEVFIDACHFNKDGHRIVAELLAPVVKALRGPKSY
ncbi:MAG: GDSL-type esterase/lipase family protein [Kiritimatiellaeota bacterium]|nr:GDSL-type esterase/lipase family protein [Kiritimatiellota bacterium]